MLNQRYNEGKIMAKCFTSIQVVQAHTTSAGGYVIQHRAELVGLADDGSVWVSSRQDDGKYSEWVRLPDLDSEK